MRKLPFFLGMCLLVFAGCEKRPKADYRPLDQSGMWSSNLAQIKKLKVNDAEIAQLTKLKQVGASDDLCLSLVNAARDHHHEFTSADGAISLSRAGYSDAEILEIAKADQIDILSGEAVTLKLIGLSNPTVLVILHRRMQGLPTLSSEQIGRLKNTGMSEKQILDLMAQGLTEQQAEAQVTKREAARNHSHTDFVRVHGRRAR
jgi:hypothetical protein